MKSLKYAISLILVIVTILIIYNSIPLFLEIKGENFLYSTYSNTKEILAITPPSQNFYPKEDEIRFIGFNYKLTNPAYPEIEFICEAKKEGKNIAIANKPSMVIIYWLTNVLYVGGDAYIPCENLQQGYHFNFPEVLLVDTKYFEDYDSISQFFIKVKTNIYLFQQKLKYSLYETGKQRGLLFDKDLIPSYKRYMFHSLKISNPD